MKTLTAILIVLGADNLAIAVDLLVEQLYYRVTHQ